CGNGCGHRPEARIIGGSTASPHSWPWQLSLRIMNGHSCGASLISPRWAITAAHCVMRSNDPHVYSLVAGAHRIDGDGVEYRINKIITHPAYGVAYHRNDIALLRLVKPVKLDSKVGTVCFPPKGSRVAPGTRCWISGSSAISVRFKSHREYIYRSVTHILQSWSGNVTRICNEEINEYKAQTMTIAGFTTRQQTDCGEPLVCEEKGSWILRGVTSWGHEKCKTDHYNVYTRVSFYISWIENQIASESRH
ncbi:unnamed protein product, partial [Porites evermanni]